MKRGIFPILSFVLIASLVLGAASAGYLRTSHAIANSGLTDIVICGSEGIRTITLDGDGNPVERQVGCAHCSDCTLSPVAETPRALTLAVIAVELDHRWSLSVEYGADDDEPIVRRARGPPTFMGLQI